MNEFQKLFRVVEDHEEMIFSSQQRCRALLMQITLRLSFCLSVGLLFCLSSVTLDSSIKKEAAKKAEKKRMQKKEDAKKKRLQKKEAAKKKQNSTLNAAANFGL